MVGANRVIMLVPRKEIRFECPPTPHTHLLWNNCSWAFLTSKTTSCYQQLAILLGIDTELRATASSILVSLWFLPRIVFFFSSVCVSPQFLPLTPWWKVVQSYVSKPTHHTTSPAEPREPNLQLRSHGTETARSWSPQFIPRYTAKGCAVLGKPEWLRNVAVSRNEWKAVQNRNFWQYNSDLVSLHCLLSYTVFDT